MRANIRIGDRAVDALQTVDPVKGKKIANDTMSKKIKIYQNTISRRIAANFLGTKSFLQENNIKGAGTDAFPMSGR